MFVFVFAEIVVASVTFFGTVIYMTNRHPGKMNSPNRLDVAVGIGAAGAACAAVWLLKNAL